MGDFVITGLRIFVVGSTRLTPDILSIALATNSLLFGFSLNEFKVSQIFRGQRTVENIEFLPIG